MQTESDKCIEKSNLVSPLPYIPAHYLDRTFSISDVNVEVCCLDVAAHGCFVAAGCTNGMVLVFDLSNRTKQHGGMLVGQIRAKGIHTNLLLTVRFSDDCRFIYAGVTKGSSEMIAIDLGRWLVDWDSSYQSISSDSKLNSLYAARQKQQLEDIVTYTHVDGKLRGFGAVVRLSDRIANQRHYPDPKLIPSVTYRLACGKGIKNVHIWEFSLIPISADSLISLPDEDNGTKDNLFIGRWTYLWDISSNSRTASVTQVVFRRGGLEVLTKASDMNLRVWDLSPGESLVSDTQDESKTVNEIETAGDEKEQIVPTLENLSKRSKPTSYTDVANSYDCKCILPTGEIAFGGTYEFAVVNTNAPKEANRDAFELPEKYSYVEGVNSSGAANAGYYGRKVSRGVEHVVSTDDGAHALILCSDGGVLYFCHQDQEDLGYQTSESTIADVNCNKAHPLSLELPEEVSSNTKTNNTTAAYTNSTTKPLVRTERKLLELDSLRWDSAREVASCWLLSRVGQQGSVILLRAMKGDSNSEDESSANNSQYESNTTWIEVKLLSELTAGQVSPVGAPASARSWHPTGEYHVDKEYQLQQRALETSRTEQLLWKKTKKVATNNPQKIAEQLDICDNETSVKSLSCNKKRSQPREFSSGKMKRGNKDTDFCTPAAPLTINERGPVEDEVDRLASAHGYHAPDSIAAPRKRNRVNQQPDSVSTLEDVDEAAASGGDRSTGTRARALSRKKQVSSPYVGIASSSSTQLKELRDDDDDAMSNNDAAMDNKGSGKLYPLRLGNAPKVHRLVPDELIQDLISSNNQQSVMIPMKSSIDPTMETLINNFELISTKWQQQLFNVTGANISDRLGFIKPNDTDGNKSTDEIFESLGFCAKQCLGQALREQDRLRNIYIANVVQKLRSVVTNVAAHGGCTEQLPSALDQLSPIIDQFRSSVTNMVRQQQYDLTGACTFDEMKRLFGGHKSSPFAPRKSTTPEVYAKLTTTPMRSLVRLEFRHGFMFDLTDDFARNVDSLLTYYRSSSINPSTDSTCSSNSLVISNSLSILPVNCNNSSQEIF